MNKKRKIINEDHNKISSQIDINNINGEKKEDIITEKIDNINKNYINLEKNTQVDFLDLQKGHIILEPIKKVKFNINTKCPGCYPIFQQNQLGHVGQNGCLGDFYYE